MLELITRKIFKEVVNGRAVQIGGLESHKEDSRDFKYKDLGGWFDYTPKHDVLVIPTLSTKDQEVLNTCVWNSFSVSREPQEKVILSPKSIVRYAVQNGYIRGNGFSSLREAQKAGVEFGIAEESVVPNIVESWNRYAMGGLTTEAKTNAATHKSKSYFTVSSKGEVLKALDDGHIIHTGFDWYSGYNMASGLSKPWILTWGKGYKVGGHAVALIGYDIPRSFFIFQNSFGKGWGDEGKFYVKMNDYLKAGVTGYVAVQLSENQLADFLSTYDGKDVKIADDPAIYRIQDGKKRPYTNALTFYAFGGRFEGDGGPSFQMVAGTVLNQLLVGAAMDVPESPFWPQLANTWSSIQWMKEAEAVKTIKNLIPSV